MQRKENQKAEESRRNKEYANIAYEFSNKCNSEKILNSKMELTVFLTSIV